MLERQLRDFSKIIVRSGASIGLAVSCSFGTPPEAPPTPTKTVTPRPTNTPLRIEAAPTISPQIKSDQEIRNLVQQAEKGQILHLSNAQIGDIYRFPWEDGQAYVVTLDTINTSGQTQTSAILLSSDCIFEFLRTQGELGQIYTLRSFPIGGIWRPNKRLDMLTAKVSVPWSTAAPFPTLNMIKLQHEGVIKECKEETALEKLKKKLNRVDWKSKPRQTAALLSWFVREIIQGIRSPSP